jgi:cobalt-zinc-cadmium efflux system protein
MIVEFIGGIYTNSLALTADAGHMLSDVGALALSYFAIWISSKPATPQKTYGYFRTEILAAFINGITLVGIALFIIYEAYLRIATPPEVKASTMIIIAIGGLIVNIIGAFLLHKESKENLNIQGAFLHIIGDLLGSIGTIIAGIIILRWNFYLADPIISIIIALLILYSSISLINEAVHVLMESTPSHINVETIKESILEIPEVIDVHDLHVWSIASNKIALSVHVVTNYLENQQILCTIDNLLKEKFNIEHSTIQIEPVNFHESGCPLNLH